MIEERSNSRRRRRRVKTKIREDGKREPYMTNLCDTDVLRLKELKKELNYKHYNTPTQFRNFLKEKKSLSYTTCDVHV